ncbi:MAG: PorT family protein [Muribaculaceae bacterium]|nr:PorT family protein [Muribaculaceae bacterium]
MKTIYFIKNLTIALMCMIIATGTLLAQNEVKQFTIKPYAGFSGSIFNVDHYSDYFDPRYGFHVGVEGEYQFAPKWSVAIGAVYSMGGAKYSDYSGSNRSATLKNDRIFVPVVARWYAWRGLSINAGIAPAFVVNATSFELNRARKFDLCVPLGISYEFDYHLVVGIEGFMGLLNVYPNKEYNENLTHSNSTKIYQYNGFVSLGYKFKVK